MGVKGRARTVLAAVNKLDSAVRGPPPSFNHPRMKAQRRCMMLARQKDRSLTDAIGRNGGKYKKLSQGPTSAWYTCLGGSKPGENV